MHKVLGKFEEFFVQFDEALFIGRNCHRWEKLENGSGATAPEPTKEKRGANPSLIGICTPLGEGALRPHLRL
jgi:hypothetical protein